MITTTKEQAQALDHLDVVAFKHGIKWAAVQDRCAARFHCALPDATPEQIRALADEIEEQSQARASRGGVRGFVTKANAITNGWEASAEL